MVGAYTHFGAHARVRAHEGTLRIGPKSVVGIRNTINCWLDIDIGSTCLLGDDIYICDFDHKTESLDLPIKDQGIVKSPVRIGDDVWMGTKVVVTRGTDIGARSVVAASAVAGGVYAAVDHRRHPRQGRQDPAVSHGRVRASRAGKVRSARDCLHASASASVCRPSSTSCARAWKSRRWPSARRCA